MRESMWPSFGQHSSALETCQSSLTGALPRLRRTRCAGHGSGHHTGVKPSLRRKEGLLTRGGRVSRRGRP